MTNAHRKHTNMNSVYEFRVRKPLPQYGPTSIPTSAIRPSLSLSTCFKEFTPWTHAQWHSSCQREHFQLLQTGLRGPGCLLKSLYTQKTTGAYMPIFAHVRSYAMQKIAQHSWLQYNRLGRIWHGHSKPNVTKSYSTYIPYIPLSTWSESKPRCHRSSRHSSNTRAAVLCTPCRVFFSCSFSNRQRKLLWTVGPHLFLNIAKTNGKIDWEY